MGVANSKPDLGSGFRCIRVHKGSPGDEAGLQSYFDWIVAANEFRFEKADDTFVRVLRSHENKPLSMKVFSVKTWKLRDVILTPRANWGGEGILGVSIRYEPILDISDQAWRVLDVAPGFPAAQSGLIAEQDFIMGSLKGPFRENEYLERCIEENLEKPMILIVYNRQDDSIREVTITPKKSPNGSLGCDLGQGILHRLPFLMPEGGVHVFPPQPSGHGHTHGGQPCHGHSHGASKPPPPSADSGHGHSHGALKPAAADSGHGHSHGGQPCHGHGHGAPKQEPAHVEDGAKEANQEHGHSHGAPKPATADSGHGHSHGGQPSHGHGHGHDAPKQEPVRADDAKEHGHSHGVSTSDSSHGQIEAAPKEEPAHPEDSHNHGAKEDRQQHGHSHQSPSEDVHVADHDHGHSRTAPEVVVAGEHVPAAVPTQAEGHSHDHGSSQQGHSQGEPKRESEPDSVEVAIVEDPSGDISGSSPNADKDGAEVVPEEETRSIPDPAQEDKQGEVVAEAVEPQPEDVTDSDQPPKETDCPETPSDGPTEPEQTQVEAPSERASATKFDEEVVSSEADPIAEVEIKRGEEETSEEVVDSEVTSDQTPDAVEPVE